MTNFVISNRNWRVLAQSRDSVFKTLSIACAFVLASVLGIGAVIALRMQMQTAVLACLALFGIVGGVIWVTLKLPVVAPLRIALIASFWFRLETELFPIIKAGHGLPVGFTLSLKLMLAIVLVGIAYFSSSKQKDCERIIPKAFTYSLILLWLCASLSVVYGKEFISGLYSLFGLASVTLIFFVIPRYFGNIIPLKQAVISIATAIIFNSVLGILQYTEIFAGWQMLGATVDDAVMTIPGSEISRASGLLEMSNSFGWYLATFLPVVIAPVLLAKRSLKTWQGLLCATAFILGILALILTFSRGSWAAFILTFPLLIIFTLFKLSPRERWQVILRCIGLLMVITALCAPFLEAALLRLTQDDQGSAESRVSLMQVARAMILDNPWVGVGLGSYEATMGAYDLTEDYISENFPYPVHNMFMHIAAEAGIPALVCLLLMTLIALHCGWQVWRDSEGEPLAQAIAVGLMTGTLAYLITGLKEPTSLDSGQIRVLFLLYGLLIANRLANKRARIERRSAE
ncbi:MAG TPA: O-antigen ligase family protein [Blastocatellia bacterium]|nr:O-antigen ligase family protein [Blastocatellia bacterium]